MEAAATQPDVQACEVPETWTLPEFDQAVRRAADACQTPIALVTVLADDRHWIVSSIGIDVREMPRRLAFCAQAILDGEPLVIPDARQDARFAASSLVTGSLGLRFYAGVPLFNADGLALGVLCVLDNTRPRLLSGEQLEELDAIAREVGIGLELRRVSTELRAAERALMGQQAMHDAIVAAALDCIITIEADGRVVEFNPAAERTFGYTREEVVGRTMSELIVPPHLRDGHEQGMARLLATGEPRILNRRVELTAMRRDGSEFPIELTVTQLAAEPPLFSGHIRDISERARLEAKLRHDADHDSMTGLVNRRVFEKTLEGLAHGRQRGPSGSVIFIDLDHFKLVNDSLGHRAGDELIRRVADSLRSGTRVTDTVARLGGDEFAVLLPGCPGPEALRIADDLIVRIAADIGTGNAGASAGIAVIHPGAGAEDVMAAADMALYDAKTRGRRRAILYSGQDSLTLRTVADVRNSIAAGRLVLHAQPIIELATSRVVQHELLVRMLDRDGRVIPPIRFIPIAERFGLIEQVDRWVVSRAAELARRGRNVAVNISAHTLNDPAMIALLQEQLRAGLPTGNLSFEITETAALFDVASARDFAGRLTGMGCGFALDDFGTGYGSLMHLKRLPVTALKIDMEFVQNLSRDAIDRHIVEALVGIARALGLTTVAEGVENPETLELLRELHIDRAQGYYIGRPAEIGTAEEEEEEVQAA